MDETANMDEAQDMVLEGLPTGAPMPLPALGRLLNRASRAINLVAESRLAAHDLTLPQWVVLTALWRADGLMVTHLADYCANGQPALSRILDRMESKGLVRRQASSQDRRSVRVYLTSEAKELAPLIECYKEFHEIMMKGLDTDQRAMLFQLLEQLIANAEAYQQR